MAGIRNSHTRYFVFCSLIISHQILWPSFWFQLSGNAASKKMSKTHQSREIFIKKVTDREMSVPKSLPTKH